MPSVRGALVAVLAATALTPLPSAGAQSADATVPSACTDQTVAPPRVVLGCDKEGVIAEDLVWQDWGAARATAAGTVAVSGEKYAVGLIADRLRACKYGKPQYTRVSWAFPSGATAPPASSGVADGVATFPCPHRPHADPRIRSMRMRLTGHHPGGDDYYVRTRIRLRVCAVRGPAKVVMNESLGLSGQLISEHTRRLRFRQSARCQWHAFKWRLGNEFFGVGTYRVAATVADTDDQESKTVSRRHTTND